MPDLPTFAHGRLASTMFPTPTPAQIARTSAREVQDPPGRGARRGRRQGGALRGHRGRGRGGPPHDAVETVIVAQAGSFTGEEHDPGRRVLSRVREAGEDRAQSRPDGGAGAERRRDQRDPDARVHSAESGTGRERDGRRRARGFGSLVRDAAHQGVPDPQWSSLQVHRPRPRRGRAGAPRSFPRRRRGSAGAHLPWRCRAQESEQPADCRMPRVQRRGRSDARARLGSSGPDRWVSAAVRRLGGTRRPGWTNAGRTGGSSSKIENYLGFLRHFVRSSRPRACAGAEIRRAGDHRKGATQLRAAGDRTRSRSTRATASRRAPSSSRRGSNTGGCRSRTSSGSKAWAFTTGRRSSKRRSAAART